MIKSNIKDGVILSFVADALALGVHWVYDVNAIAGRYGRLEKMVAPKLASFHSSKEMGEFTHYGDQALVLLESIAEQSGFKPDAFKEKWLALFENYTGYLDSATKETLKNLKTDPGMHPEGSMSSDLGGAARISPLALVFSEDINGFCQAAQTQTAMTHNQEAVVQSARFFAMTAMQVFAGSRPVEAMAQVLAEYEFLPAVDSLIRAGLESAQKESKAVISQFGMACSVDGALPSAVHLIARYETDPKTALVENIMAGGDSSARGMMAGFILGSYNGLESIPETWFSDMKAFSLIERCLSQF